MSTQHTGYLYRAEAPWPSGLSLIIVARNGFYCWTINTATHLATTTHLGRGAIIPQLNTLYTRGHQLVDEVIVDRFNDPYTRLKFSTQGFQHIIITTPDDRHQYRRLHLAPVTIPEHDPHA